MVSEQPWRQTATATIASGSVDAITLGTAKTGYSQSNPPVVLIESPALLAERLTQESPTAGDFGTIVGVTTTTVGVATGLVFELFIPNNSALKDATLVGTAITVSSLAAGDFFTVSNSNIGLGVTSLNQVEQSQLVLEPLVLIMCMRLSLQQLHKRLSLELVQPQLTKSRSVF